MSDLNRWNAARRQQSATVTRSVPGKFDRIYFNEAPSIVRLIPGDYTLQEWTTPNDSDTYVGMPFYYARRHFIPEASRKGTKDSYVTCPRSWNQFMDMNMCPVCANTDWNTQQVYAFTVLSLHYHHKVMKPNPKDPKRSYTNFEKCQRTPTNDNCPYCNGSYEAVLGYLGHTAFNSFDFDTITAIDTKMGQTCQCGGRIVTYEGACPTCGARMSHIETNGMTDTEFAKFMANPQACTSCNRIGVPVAHTKCLGCANPRPLTMFDANLSVSRVPVPGKNYGRLVVEIHSVGPIGPEYGAHEPLDLPAIYAPPPLVRLFKLAPGGRQGTPVPIGGLAAHDQNAVPRAIVPHPVNPNAPPLPPVMAPPMQQDMVGASPPVALGALLNPSMPKPTGMVHTQKPVSTRPNIPLDPIEDDDDGEDDHLT